ncbi:MAG: cytochrome c oxidase assembly factor Coa1 family protein [Emcibacteraceae bacterium]
MTQEVNYVSGLGKKSILPPELKDWNWGAFCLNWVWGIGNSTYIALLMFIPFVNLIMIFILGAKGNEWAWQNRTWRDFEHFKTVQKKWRNAALIIFVVVFPLFFVGISGALKGEAFDLSLAKIQENSNVIELIGTPIDAGFFVTGSVSTSGPTGEASLQYSISGPKGNAEAYVFAYKKFERWHLYEVVVIDEATEQKIQVVTPSN